MAEFTKLPDRLMDYDAPVIAEYLRLHDGILPDNVKYVSTGAFRDCTELKRLIVPDGTEIYSDACEPLTGLEEPVFNVSRTKLYRYPEGFTEEEYILPDGTEIIKNGAFFKNGNIRRVVVPETVRIIEAYAFNHCFRLSEVVIKNPGITIGNNAFCYCNRHLKIKTPNPDIPDNCGIVDTSFLVREECHDIPTIHCSDRVFEDLCAECGKGNADKMWELAGYFAEKKNKDFYRLASNFWKYRAFMFGCSEAAQWFAEREITNPGEPLAAAHWERPYGNVDSDLFRALGFPFLTAPVSYIYKVDDDGIVLAQGPFCSQEREDFDHCEYYYDWYLLNEHLAPIEGVSPIRNQSADDVKDSRQYKEMHDRAVAALNLV